jgi:hypothetical protein
MNSHLTGNHTKLQEAEFVDGTTWKALKNV